MKLFSDIYRNRRVLVTGHTGFKGSWLTLWLAEMGADITGISLPPETQPNHWDILGLDIDDRRADIRDRAEIERIFKEKQPEIVFHLAAQPLVRRSYRDPIETWTTNVLGTANLLDVCRDIPEVRAFLCVTTDKCYENREWVWGYREIDPLGGHDPYSASKACAELVTASYRSSFFEVSGSAAVSTARAGNVIGGGDWSEDRLIPDIVRALTSDKPLDVRFPQATRPWQHVLEPLGGYLLLGKRMLDQDHLSVGAWNFGPSLDSNCSVNDVLLRLKEHWPILKWKNNTAPQPHESTLLYLDSSKARSLLGWKPVWGIDQTLEATASWYRSWYESGTAISRQQLNQYVLNAQSAGVLL